jgi:hypothetical protein
MARKRLPQSDVAEETARILFTDLRTRCGSDGRTQVRRIDQGR